MRKIIALIAAIFAFAAFTSVAQANTTDSCVDFGSGQNNCFTTTFETNVDFGTVHMGKFSVGTFTLVCTKYNEVFVKQGRIAKNGTRNFFVEGLFGLHNPDCTLSAHAISTVDGRRASASVTLID